MLKENLQNKWVPAPSFIETSEIIKTEKINADIPENTLRIIFGKTTYNKDKRLYLIVTYPEKNLKETFNQKAPGDWSHQFDWKFDKSDFRTLFKNKFHVDIYEKRTIFRDSLKGQFDIEPKQLKDHIEQTESFKIQLESKRDGTAAEVTFKVRYPCKERIYEEISKPLFQLTRIFPPFDIRGQNNTQGGVKLDVPQTKVTADDLKVTSNTTSQKPHPNPQKTTQTKNVPTAKPKAPQGGGAPKKQGPPKEHIDKSEFSPDELDDPDHINCLQTLKVLEFKINKYQAISDKIEGRTPRALMQRIIRMKCKKKSLEESLGEDIGPEDYLTLLKTTFAHDKKLVDYFNQEKDKEKSLLVSERLPLLFQETEELMKQMKK
jgi:hypothetical protein